MNQFAEVDTEKRPSWQATAIAIGSALTLLLSIWMTAGPVPNAKADVFGNMSICSYSWVAPYGKAGDKCAANLGGYLWAVSGQSYEHSACVSVLNNIGNVSSNWLCTPGPNGYTGVKWFTEDGIWRRGVLRNNTTGSGAHVSGTQTCITCG